MRSTPPLTVSNSSNKLSKAWSCFMYYHRGRLYDFWKVSKTHITLDHQVKDIVSPTTLNSLYHLWRERFWLSLWMSIILHRVRLEDCMVIMPIRNTPNLGISLFALRKYQFLTPLPLYEMSIIAHKAVRQSSHHNGCKICAGDEAVVYIIALQLRGF